MAEVPKFPAIPATSGGPGEFQDARYELVHHRLFIRAAAHSRGMSAEVKDKIVQAMFKIVTHPGRRKKPSQRERISAARVLAAFAAQDTSVFLECLKELHQRERTGLEPYYPPAVLATIKPGETEAEEPTVRAEEFPKELSEAAIKQLFNERYPTLIQDLSRDR